MSGRLSSFGWAAAAAMVGNWLDRLLQKFWRPIAVVLLAPLIYLWTQAVMLTGSVRGGTVLLLGGIVVVAALCWWGRELAVTLWLASARDDRPAPAIGGPDPECLYRWHEPTDLPYGAVCSCGKPRFPGELVYVGITNDMVRRSKDDDRRAACWWHVGLTGTVETYASRAAVEAAERRAIGSENPRENIAHAGRR